MTRVRLKIREIAEAKGWTQTRLHTRSEVAAGTVKKIWRDPFAEVNITTLRRFAEVLGVETRDLIEDVPDEDEPIRAE